MVSADGEEVTVEGAIGDQEVEKDEDGQEVIKVYIFKADSGEDDLGELRLCFPDLTSEIDSGADCKCSPPHCGP